MSTVTVTCSIVYETRRAWCCSVPGLPDDVWLPKQFVRVLRDGVTIPLWLAKDRGIPPAVMTEAKEKPLYGWEN